MSYSPDRSTEVASQYSVPWVLNRNRPIPLSQLNGVNMANYEMQIISNACYVFLSSIARQKQNPYFLFEEYARQWEEDTELFSSSFEMFMHPSYQKIIAMGPQAIPLILKRMNEKPDHWFWALEVLTNQDPVPPKAKGDFDEMVEAWLDWGRTYGYL